MLQEIPDARLVFLDKSGFNLHVNPVYGRALSGQHAYIKHQATMAEI